MRNLLPSRKAWILYLVTVLPVVALIGYLGVTISQVIGVLQLEPIMYYWDSETSGGSEIEWWTLGVLGYPVPRALGVLVGVVVAAVLAVMWLQVVRAIFSRGDWYAPHDGA